MLIGTPFILLFVGVAVIAHVWVAGVLILAFITDTYAEMPQLLRWIPFRACYSENEINLLNLFQMFLSSVGILLGCLFAWPIFLGIGILLILRQIYRQREEILNWWNNSKPDSKQGEINLKN